MIKRHHVEDHLEEVVTEDSTIRNYDSMSPGSFSGRSSNGSVRGAPSEDWSVISEQDERRSSLGSGHSEGRSAKRTSLAAAVLAILPDTFATGFPQHRELP